MISRTSIRSSHVILGNLVAGYPYVIASLAKKSTVIATQGDSNKNITRSIKVRDCYGTRTSIPKVVGRCVTNNYSGLENNDDKTHKLHVTKYHAQQKPS